MPIRSTTDERLTDSFVESRLRPEKTTQEVFLTNLLPLPVTLDGVTRTTFSRFFQAASVAGLATQTIATQVVSETGYRLQNIEVSGSNKATYKIYLNGVLIGLKRTYYLGFNEMFIFPNTPLALADVLRVDVVNNSNSIADFEARLIGYRD